MVRFSDLKDTDSDSGRKKKDSPKKDAAAPERKPLRFRDFEAEGESEFLNKDAPVPKRKPLRFRELESEEESVLSDSDSHEEDFAEEDIEKLYEEASEYLIQVFDAIRNRKKFELEQGIEIIEKMVASHQAMNSLFVIALHHDDKVKFWVKACVNVAIYAIKMAENLGFNKDRQVEIGLAGLLHDVGMGVIPESIISKKEKLTEEEFQIFKDRPKYAYKILQAFEDQYAYLAECAFQVNERLDGSGYPRGLKGDEIHEYALIIGLVDTYEAMVHSRPQREKFLHFSAVKEIIKTGKNQYQKHHLKALLNIFSIFPLNSYVKLNSNAIGQVIETYPEQPMRPKLKIIYDSQGKKVLTDRIDNLADNSLLYIVDSVAEEELKTLSFQTESALFSQEKPEGKKEVPLTEKAEDTPSGKPETSRPTDRKTQLKDRVKQSSWYPIALIPFIFGGAILILWVLWEVWKPESKPIVTDTSKQFVRNVIEDSHQTKRVNVSRPEAGPETAQQPISGQEPSDEPEKMVPEKAQKEMDLQQSPVETAPEITENIMPEEQVRIEQPKSETLEEKKNSITMVQENVKAETEKTPLKTISESGLEATEDEMYPYSILIASFRYPEGAKESVERYNEMGLSAYWVKVDLGDSGIWYRVFAGHFKSIHKAEETVEQFNLKNALVKKTQFAALIGTFSSKEEATSKIRFLMETGYSPYAISEKTGNFRVYIGAFYTKKGAEAQCLELISKGISCEIIER